MSKVIWVTGASSGIGSAFVAAVPPGSARVIGVSRRTRSGIENLVADLSEPASWDAVAASFREVMGDGTEYDDALLFHCAGTVAATGSMIAADPAHYTRSVLLNSAAGQVLGRAFLVAAAAGRCRATLVMCSSPGASTALAGMSHYCGGKAALEHWTRAVAQEFGDSPQAPRIFSVVPHAVDTAMVRDLAAGDGADAPPIGAFFRSAIADSATATPEQVAREIWVTIERGVAQGAAVNVGAVHAST